MVYTVLYLKQMKPKVEASMKVYSELKPKVARMAALQSKLKLIQPTTAAIIQQVRYILQHYAFTYSADSKLLRSHAVRLSVFEVVIITDEHLLVYVVYTTRFCVQLLATVMQRYCTRTHVRANCGSAQYRCGNLLHILQLR
jgi:hypothetical protein